MTKSPFVKKATEIEVTTTDTFVAFDDSPISDDVFVMQGLQVAVSDISSATELTVYIVGGDGASYKKYSVPSALSIVADSTDPTKGVIFDIFSPTPLAVVAEYGQPSGIRISCDTGTCTASVYLAYTQTV